MSTVTTANANTAVGSKALMNCTHQANTAVGFEALEVNTSGDTNTAIGALSLTANTTGGNNTGVGGHTLQQQTTATENTAVGRQAGHSVTTGIRNTMIGKGAGENNMTTGENNLVLGYNATVSASGVNNQVILGNSSIEVIRCQVQTISSLSDERDKTNIVDSEDGLDLINLLKPRKFTWAMREKSVHNGKTNIGFIAQELDTVFGDKNNYVKIIDKSNEDKLAVAEGKLIPIMVKAIQELSAKVTALEAG